MKPANLLVLMSDEHNPKFLGAAGHPFVATPHLDALAARGTRFTSAYTSCPICVPARAAFAVGRSQEVLYDLRELEEAGRIPSLPVFLDSPMGIQATAIYAQHPDEHDAAYRRVAAGGKRPFAPRRFEVTRTVDDSKRLNDVPGPGIILAGSGMATGGRILHHFRRLLPLPETTVLFVGYQAAGTRGRLLRDGAKELRMFGGMVSVRATIMASDAYSAHADRAEILHWLGGFKRPPGITYIVHGEPEAAAALREAVVGTLGWRAEGARDGQRVTV